MALNIKNHEVETLASEMASATGESKTEAIRQSLLMRRERLALQASKTRIEDLRKFLEEEVWSKLPASVRGVGMSQKDQDDILGFGPEGY